METAHTLDNLQIKCGDKVSVNFNSAPLTLCFSATVLHVPQATGDSWIFEDANAIHYVSEPCTVTKIKL
jgi:hypothetical protein